jgi:hypothetical protein
VSAARRAVLPPFAHASLADRQDRAGSHLRASLHPSSLLTPNAPSRCRASSAPLSPSQYRAVPASCGPRLDLLLAAHNVSASSTLQSESLLHLLAACVGARCG